MTFGLDSVFKHVEYNLECVNSLMKAILLAVVIMNSNKSHQGVRSMALFKIRKVTIVIIISVSQLQLFIIKLCSAMLLKGRCR